MSDFQMLNGVVTDDKSVKDSDADVSKKLPVKISEKDEIQKISDEGAPLKSIEKRKTRLNRRSLHLINNPIADFSNGKLKPVAEAKCIIGSEKNKVDIPQKKVISLASVKKSCIEINPSKETKVISLKRSSSSDGKKLVETSETCDQPVQKKHKPITWP